MRSRILPNWESGMDLQGARRERFWGQGSKPKSSFFYKKRAFLTKRGFRLPFKSQFGEKLNSKNYTSIVKNLKPSEKIHTRGGDQISKQFETFVYRPTTLVNSNKLQFRILRTELSGKNLNLQEKLKNPRYTSSPKMTAI
jgi:hypothetical protein